MKSQQLAATIGLILFSASIAIPVKGHSADLKSLLGNVITNAAKDKISSSTASKTPQFKGTQSKAPPSDIALIQAELNRRNYAAGAVDGKAGPKTTAAIKRCQLDNGWEPTGILTAAQRDHLLGSGNVGAVGVASGVVVPLLLNRGTGVATVINPSLESDGLNSTEVNRIPTSGNLSSTTGSAGSDSGRNPTSTGLSDTLLEQNNATVTNRRKQRERFKDGGSPTVVDTANGAANIAGTTATVTEGQNLNTAAGDSQQSLKSLLTTSTQPSGDESTTTKERNRVTSRTSVRSATETRRTTTGDAAAVGAGRRAGTGNAVIDADCTRASLRNRECVPNQ